MRSIVITLVCLALAAPAFAGMYKWTDENGKIHFTDSMNQVPLDQRNKKQIQKLRSTRGGKNNLPTAVPHPSAPKHLGAKKDGSNSNSGIDKQRVHELQRLIQKKHYSHK